MMLHFVSYGSCVEHKSGQFSTELHKTLVCKNGQWQKTLKNERDDSSISQINVLNAQCEKK